ncbi:hypothetical protein [Streptomyces sp. NBC_01717]|uniref:hypothetical protein n=1 Tax=Streptomyces sp. NBC_01717 TaxID=2975918 RepID=UPI002E30D761|nr:hypothetical protein [Streptomyces sp. NBC_01717]
MRTENSVCYAITLAVRYADRTHHPHPNPDRTNRPHPRTRRHRPRSPRIPRPATSMSKRCSADAERGAACGTTGRSSRPWERSWASRPTAVPRSRWRVVSGVSAMPPML